MIDLFLTLKLFNYYLIYYECYYYLLYFLIQYFSVQVIIFPFFCLFLPNILIFFVYKMGYVRACHSVPLHRTREKISCDNRYSRIVSCPRSLAGSGDYFVHPKFGTSRSPTPQRIRFTRSSGQLRRDCSCSPARYVTIQGDDKRGERACERCRCVSQQ